MSHTECLEILHSNFSSKLPLDVIDNAVINSAKLIEPSCKNTSYKQVVFTRLVTSYKQVMFTRLVTNHKQVVFTWLVTSYKQVVFTRLVTSYKEVVFTRLVTSYKQVVFTRLVTSYKQVMFTRLVTSRQQVVTCNYARSYLVRSRRVWNTLPAEMHRNFTSLATFKTFT